MEPYFHKSIHWEIYQRVFIYNIFWINDLKQIIENKVFFNASFNEILINPVFVNLKCLQGKMQYMKMFTVGENVCGANIENECRENVFLITN